jgi:hypothetical protein
MTKGAVALSLLAVACRSGTGTTTVPPDGGAHQSQYTLDLNPRRELDLLFVVENTPGMAAKQRELARVLPLLFEELGKGPGGLPDLHVGVVTSDLGAGAELDNGCRKEGDKAELVIRDCAAVSGPERFLTSARAGTMNNFQGELAAAAGCLVQVGESGCAFPSPLKATSLALVESDTPANRGFLRASAALAVVFAADRDDCSAPDGGAFHASAAPGQSPALRCALAGHQCNGVAPAGEGFEAPLASCAPTAEGMLLAVKGVVEGLKTLKRQPNQLRMAALMAPLDGPVAAYRLGRDPAGAVGPLPLCDSALGGAQADLRLDQVIKDLGGVGRVFDLCSADLSAPVQALGVWLRSANEGYCLPEMPADGDPATDGVQPACSATLSRSPSGGSADQALPRCQNGGPLPCYELVEDPTCTDGHWKVRVQQGGAPGPDDRLLLKCL